MIRLCISLGAVCLVGSAALVWVNSMTFQAREEAKTAELTRSLQMVLPPETAGTAVLEEKSTDTVTLFQATDPAGKVIAYAAEGQANGFGGPLKVLVGFEKDGTIRAVMVTQHNETPGLGSKAAERKAQQSLWDFLSGKKVDSSFPPNPFLDAFAGQSAAAFSHDGKGTVDAVSGATISSRAILASVHEVCGVFQASNLQ